jgi:hypothetical protein
MQTAPIKRKNPDLNTAFFYSGFDYSEQAQVAQPT